jgi:hypothetical protein
MPRFAQTGLLVEPDILQPPIVIDAVLVQDDAFDVGMPAGCRDIVQDDGPCHIEGQFALGLPHHLLALGLIGLLRLLEDQRVDLGVAVLGVVAFRLQV